jgi:hypothetical protein
MSNVFQGEGLLDREVTERFVLEHLGDGLAALRRIVDEGTGILEKIASSGYVMDDVGRVVVGHLFSHFLALLDGAETLLRCGAGYAVKAQLRAMVEACGSIAWILKSDTKFRAQAYTVGYYRGLGQFAREHLDDGSDSAEIEAAIDAGAAGLASSRFSEVDRLFEEHANRQKREPAWHAIKGGPRYMRELLRDAELPDELQFFWARFSGFSHGHTMEDRTILGNRDMRIVPLRDIGVIAGDTLTTGMLAFVVYRNICKFALPEHNMHVVNRFRRWLAQIRKMPETSYRDIGDNEHANE